VVHALLSLRETLAAGTELSTANVALGFVSADAGFTLLEDDKVQPYLDMLGAAEVSGAAAPAAAMVE
jgi:hypothetical protein